MDNITDILLKIDLAQLAAIGVMMWFFYSRLDAKIEKLDAKIEKLDAKINDIDKRVFAIETMLHMKDCCVLKSDSQMKKAE